MQKKRTISDIKDFTVYNNIVYSIDLNDTFCRQSKQMLNGVFSIRGIYKNFLLLFDDNNIRTVVWDMNTDEFICLDYVFSILGKTESFLIIGVRQKNEYMIAEYDFENHKIIKTYPYKATIEAYYEGMVVLQEENVISSYNIEDEKQFWQKEFSEKITGDILPYKDKLLISLKNDDFICLEQATGKKIWKCEQVYGYRKIIEEKFSYQLVHDSFTVVDLERGKKTVDFSLEQLIEKHNVLPVGAEIVKDRDRIFFISIGFSAKYKPAVGIFNIQTKSFDWIHRFEGLKNQYGFSGTNCLQYHNGQLCVLTNDGVLHVFEDE